MNIVLSVPHLKPLHKSSHKMTTTMKLNKFDNFKNKIISLEKKRFSRLQDELKTKKSNLEEDLKEIDAIMKETFTKNMCFLTNFYLCYKSILFYDFYISY